MTDDLCGLQGKVAVVTGASRGIGAAIAQRLARDGAAVAVHGRDRDALAAVCAGIRDGGADAVGPVIPVIAELTDPAAAAAMRERIEAELGPSDILVANAGGNPVPPKPLEEIDLAEWAASIDANLTATFLTIHEFLPGMKQRGGGSIVTVSSAAARRPSAQSPIPYTAAKAGIEVLTQLVATQAGPAGVRVNCVAPETILTERSGSAIPPDIQERLVGLHPIRRLGEPADVADAVRFLAGDGSSWISGVVLDVAGGAVLAR